MSIFVHNIQPYFRQQAAWLVVAFCLLTGCDKSAPQNWSKNKSDILIADTTKLDSELKLIFAQPLVIADIQLPRYKPLSCTQGTLNILLFKGPENYLNLISVYIRNNQVYIGFTKYIQLEEKYPISIEVTTTATCP